MPVLGTRIKDFRASVPLTQRQLAERARVPHSTIACIESGIVEPSADSMFRLAGAFKHPIEEVFDFFEDRPSSLRGKGRRRAGWLTVLALVLFIAPYPAQVGFLRFSISRAWAAGDYYQARSLQSDLYSIEHPIARAGVDEALAAGAACRPGMGEPPRLPPPATSSAWLVHNAQWRDVASFEDASGNLYHQVLADCLDRVHASAAAVIERRQLIDHPWIPGPYNETNEFGDYLEQASRAAIMGDPAAAAQLLRVDLENHRARLLRLFAYRSRMPYHLEVLRPVFKSLLALRTIS